MKEGQWSECLESASAIAVSPNSAKARSLIDIAQGRIAFLGGLPVAEQNANYIFEGFYSSAMEMLQAIVLLGGYKVLNHVCLGFYLRDILKRADLFRLFDDCRYKRNSLVYYGRRMDMRVSNEAVRKARELIGELEIIIKRTFG